MKIKNKKSTKTNKNYSLMARATLLIMILILPFNIVGIVTSYMSYHNSITNSEEVISYALESYASMLNTKISNSNYLLYSTSTNDYYFSNMCDNTDSPMYKIYVNSFFKNMNNHLENANTADWFFVYIPSNMDYIQSPAYTSATIDQHPFLQYVENYNSSYGHWFINPDENRLTRVIYDSQYHAYLGVSIDLTAFLEQMVTYDSYPSLTYQISEKPLESSSAGVAFDSKIMDRLFLSASVEYTDLFNNINIIVFILLAFFIAYLALIPLLIKLMKKHVGIPLMKLNQGQDELKKGNENYRIEHSVSSLEFNNAISNFNDMADSIQTLHADVLEKELSNKQLQIDYLQLQIRPHFLLNAFNVLYTLIQKGEKDASQDMVLFLSDYFRYLFRSGRELQLFSKERKLIEDYLRISKIYYPVSFEVSYQLDPILDMMRVPPLLLHSFIENIIAHALLPDRCVHIVFSGEYDNGIVTFYISDDGKGMDEEQINSIKHAAERPIDDGSNVGIKNSIRRLLYYYGQDASVDCESELEFGTTFIITIPYNLEETP